MGTATGLKPTGGADGTSRFEPTLQRRSRLSGKLGCAGLDRLRIRAVASDSTAGLLGRRCGGLGREGVGVGYPVWVSPTVLRVRGFRFYFFSREERRAHVHVQHADGEAKFWIEPTVELHANYGLKPKQLAEAEQLVEEHLNDIRSAWATHFPG